MRIECDEFGDWLYIDGDEFGPSEDRVFNVPATRLKRVNLSDLPRGVGVHLCNRIVGSKDLDRRSPYCTFEHASDGHTLAHVETALFPESEDLEPKGREAFLRHAVENGLLALEPLRAADRLLSVDHKLYDEIAYLTYSLVLPDQPILEAESFVDAIETRIHDGVDRPLLFVCHASEDKLFVERLITELDRRALYAWFDKREILVGDSIVGKISDALIQVRYLVAVLSPASVRKPWVARELNSSLARQLAEQNIKVLPILIQDCEVPSLLADLKYADFRTSFDNGLAELLASIRR